MLRSKRVKNGTACAGRISSVLVVGWLIIGWSRPAFPDEGRHLQLAPIRFGSDVGGSVGYTYQSNTYGTSKSATQTFDAHALYNARAKSFFWQPWLAQVSAGLGIDFFSSTSRSTSVSNNAANTRVNSEAALDILKYSRFPFRAHVFKSDSHANGDNNGINSGYKNSGYDLTQQYKTRRGNFDGLIYFLHNKGGRADFGAEQINDSLNMTLSGQPFKHQTFKIVGASLDISQPLKGITNTTDSLNANHLYQPNSTFSMGSLVNLINNNYTLKSGNITPQQYDLNSRQLSSYASWRPIQNALTVTSSVRLLRSEQSSNNSPSLNYDNSNFNLGANYAWSRLLRTYGSVNVNDSDGIQTVSTNAALSAQKMFGDQDLVNLGGFKYSRYAGASLSNSTVTKSVPQTTGPNQTTTTSVQSLGGNVGHALGKTSELGGGRLQTTLFQRLSEVLSTRTTPVSRLRSGGTLAWHRSGGREATTLSLRATDYRELTGNQSFGQIINLQASRNVNLLNHQSLTGNLTIQSSRSGFSGESTPFLTTPSADLVYMNERLFAVKNLNFNSNLSIIGSEIASSQSSNPLNLSAGNTARVSWRNDLHYRIGRLELKLNSQIAEVNGVHQTMLYFNMRRSF
jgi:hypothetical protein